MNGGIFSPEIWDNLTPANVLGGISRAKTAIRDRFGRFVSKNGEIKPAERHGQRGGKIRASLAIRDNKGRFSNVRSS